MTAARRLVNLEFCRNPRSHVSSSCSTQPFSTSALGKVSNNIRIAGLNANSVKGKKTEIAEFCNSTEMDVLVITETKVDNTISSSEFLPRNYDGHIRRDPTTSSGGVMVAVRNSLVVDEVSLKYLNSEIVCTRLSIVKANPLYIVVYFRPPDNDESVNGLEAALADLQGITKNNPQSSIVVAGDFNTKDIQWGTLNISP